MKNDFFNGIIVGGVQTLTGHPFDTMKVLKQNNFHSNNINLNKLYRGITYPMLGSGLFNSIQFGTYQHFQKKLDNTIYSGFLSGMFAGILLGPIDVLKINKQINNKNNINIFRGLHITCLRESLSTSIYFTTYYNSLNYFDEKNSFNSFLCGGLAGGLSWFFTFPIDVVKTRVQSYKFNDITSAIKYGNLWNGLSFCLIRAFIVNGSGFLVYNWLSD